MKYKMDASIQWGNGEITRDLVHSVIDEAISNNRLDEKKKNTLRKIADWKKLDEVKDGKVIELYNSFSNLNSYKEIYTTKSKTQDAVQQVAENKVREAKIKEIKHQKENKEKERTAMAKADKESAAREELDKETAKRKGREENERKAKNAAEASAQKKKQEELSAQQQAILDAEAAAINAAESAKKEQEEMKRLGGLLLYWLPAILAEGSERQINLLSTLKVDGTLIESAKIIESAKKAAREYQKINSKQDINNKLYEAAKGFVEGLSKNNLNLCNEYFLDGKKVASDAVKHILIELQKIANDVVASYVDEKTRSVKQPDVTEKIGQYDPASLLRSKPITKNQLDLYSPYNPTSEEADASGAKYPSAAVKQNDNPNVSTARDNAPNNAFGAAAASEFQKPQGNGLKRVTSLDGLSTASSQSSVVDSVELISAGNRQTTVVVSGGNGNNKSNVGGAAQQWTSAKPNSRKPVHISVESLDSSFSNKSSDDESTVYSEMESSQSSGNSTSRTNVDERSVNSGKGMQIHPLNTAKVWPEEMLSSSFIGNDVYDSSDDETSTATSLLENGEVRRIKAADSKTTHKQFSNPKKIDSIKGSVNSAPEDGGQSIYSSRGEDISLDGYTARVSPQGAPILKGVDTVREWDVTISANNYDDEASPVGNVTARVYQSSGGESNVSEESVHTSEADEDDVSVITMSSTGSSKTLITQDNTPSIASSRSRSGSVPSDAGYETDDSESINTDSVLDALGAALGVDQSSISDDSEMEEMVAVLGGDGSKASYRSRSSSVLGAKVYPTDLDDDSQSVDTNSLVNKFSAVLAADETSVSNGEHELEEMVAALNDDQSAVRKSSAAAGPTDSAGSPLPPPPPSTVKSKSGERQNKSNGATALGNAFPPPPPPPPPSSSYPGPYLGNTLKVVNEGDVTGDGAKEAVRAAAVAAAQENEVEGAADIASNSIDNNATPLRSSVSSDQSSEGASQQNSSRSNEDNHSRRGGNSAGISGVPSVTMQAGSGTQSNPVTTPTVPADSGTQQRSVKPPVPLLNLNGLKAVQLGQGTGPGGNGAIEVIRAAFDDRVVRSASHHADGDKVAVVSKENYSDAEIQAAIKRGEDKAKEDNAKEGELHGEANRIANIALGGTDSHSSNQSTLENDSTGGRNNNRSHQSQQRQASATTAQIAGGSIQTQQQGAAKPVVVTSHNLDNIQNGAGGGNYNGEGEINIFNNATTRKRKRSESSIASEQSSFSDDELPEEMDDFSVKTTKDDASSSLNDRSRSTSTSSSNNSGIIAGNIIGNKRNRYSLDDFILGDIAQSNTAVRGLKNNKQKKPSSQTALDFSLGEPKTLEELMVRIRGLEEALQEYEKREDKKPTQGVAKEIIDEFAKLRKELEERQKASDDLKINADKSTYDNRLGREVDDLREDMEDLRWENQRMRDNQRDPNPQPQPEQKKGFFENLSWQAQVLSILLFFLFLLAFTPFGLAVFGAVVAGGAAIGYNETRAEQQRTQVRPMNDRYSDRPVSNKPRGLYAVERAREKENRSSDIGRDGAA